MKLVLQLFRGATFTAVYFITLVTTASGGVLQKTGRITLGIDTWTTMRETYTGLTLIRDSGYLSVVLKISNLFDYAYTVFVYDAEYLGFLPGTGVCRCTAWQEQYSA